MSCPSHIHITTLTEGVSFRAFNVNLEASGVNQRVSLNVSDRQVDSGVEGGINLKLPSLKEGK